MFIIKNKTLIKTIFPNNTPIFAFVLWLLNFMPILIKHWIYVRYIYNKMLMLQKCLNNVAHIFKEMPILAIFNLGNFHWEAFHTVIKFGKL